MDATTPNKTVLEELCKRIQHCFATLRRSQNKRNVGSCWLKSLTSFKLCATTSNNMQQGVQTDASCNIQQCWELLPTKLRPFGRGLRLRANGRHIVDQQLPTLFNVTCCVRLHILFHVVGYCCVLLRKVGNRSNFSANNSQHFFCSVIAEA